MGQLLIGSFTARLDKSGRIKIPEKFRLAIEENFGKEVFITSLNDQSIQIYPLSVWLNLTNITGEGFLHLKPEIKRFLLRVNHMGTHYEIDSKGRILISQHLRDKARLDGEVEVLGLHNYIEVWNPELLEESVLQQPLTDEDFEHISRLSPLKRESSYDPD
ncbi:MAG: division/cell wall cluster transcriptional repressor MraZ [Acidobacteriota bacterium]